MLNDRCLRNAADIVGLHLRFASAQFGPFAVAAVGCLIVAADANELVDVEAVDCEDAVAVVAVVVRWELRNGRGARRVRGRDANGVAEAAAAAAVAAADDVAMVLYAAVFDGVDWENCVQNAWWQWHNR